MVNHPVHIAPDLGGNWSRSTLKDSNGTCWLRGYAFVQGQYLEGAQLLESILRELPRDSETRAVNHLESLLPDLNGAWALVAHWPDGQVFAAVDRCRTIPLFYRQTSDGLAVSDSVRVLIDNDHQKALSDRAACDFLLAGYVTGRETLLPDIHKLAAGEMLQYDPAASRPYLTVTRYYRFLPTCHSSENEWTLRENFVEIVDAVFARWCEALRDKVVYVPLSGGVDSRLIAAMFKRHGLTNVHCYSYGRPGNEDSAVGRQVAEVLGFPWHFTIYDEHTWHQDLGDPALQEYWERCSQYTSLPHFQDWPAVRSLLDKHADPAKSVFVPGHSVMGDTIPSALYYRGAKTTISDLRSIIARDHYHLWPVRVAAGVPDTRELVHQRIERDLAVSAEEMSDSHFPLCEEWVFRNRKSLFITNSVRVYEYCKAAWALPFFDYELIDLFCRIPARLRRRRALGLEAVFEDIFSGDLSPLAGIPLANIGDWHNARIKRGRDLAVRLIETIGLLDYVRAGRTQRGRIDPMAFDTWFSGGHDPGAVTVEEAFRLFGCLDCLPIQFRNIVEQCWEAPVRTVHPNGLLAAVFLSRLYAGR